jgi:hypothetical protein
MRWAADGRWAAVRLAVVLAIQEFGGAAEFVKIGETSGC